MELTGLTLFGLFDFMEMKPGWWNGKGIGNWSFLPPWMEIDHFYGATVFMAIPTIICSIENYSLLILQPQSLSSLGCCLLLLPPLSALGC